MTKFGVQDTRRQPVTEHADNQQRPLAAPRVPFAEQWTPASGHDRDRLAAWLTHAENRRFRRATANRVWALMFGRPFISPVDDIPDPLPPGQAPNDTSVLDFLGDGFAEHGYDLRQMILTIAETRVFRQASTHPQLDDAVAAERLERAWAIFPLTPLQPAQLIRTMQQAASARPLQVEVASDWSSMSRLEGVNRFVEQYGATSDSDEEAVGTIPQTVQRLVGPFTNKLSGAKPWTGPGRIALLSGTHADCLDNCYLACFARRPTPDEQSYFLGQLRGTNLPGRTRAVEDIYWTLFNSAEFSWNH